MFHLWSSGADYAPKKQIFQDIHLGFPALPDTSSQEEFPVLRVAFVGGGKGCRELLQLLCAYKAKTFTLEIVGVADPDPKAPGRHYAHEMGLWTTGDYRDFFKGPEPDLLVELTGRDDVLEELLHTKPSHVKILDHVGARLLWEIIEIQQEKLALEERLAASEKMVAVGEMSYHLAHELRNPLMCIGGLTRRILRYPQTPAILRQRLELIVRHVRQMERAIAHVCDVARPLEPHYELVNLKDMFQELCKNVRREAKRYRVRVHCEIDQDLPSFFLDADLMREALWHVVRNAFEAMVASGGELTMRADLCWDEVMIVLEDTGPGINEDLKEQAFRPFYTTKEGRTGLGLALCRKIVWDHGGEITLRRKPEGGTAVVIELPVRFQELGAPPV